MPNTVGLALYTYGKPLCVPPNTDAMIEADVMSSHITNVCNLSLQQAFSLGISFSNKKTIELIEFWLKLAFGLKKATRIFVYVTVN